MRSLAVLPLANLTGDPAQEYFSDGMTDALITNLASLPALHVISRQSVMRYKGSAKPMPEIARELGVEGVVEGSVVRSGGRVRITAQLDPRLHRPPPLGPSYERPLQDVLALQGELSRAIAEEVRITLGAKESRRLTPSAPVNPDAYDDYLLGRHHWNLRTERRWAARSNTSGGRRKDPDFALAHAGLALLRSTARPRLRAAWRRSAELKAAARRRSTWTPGSATPAPRSPPPVRCEWDWDGAEAEFRSAIETDPSSTSVTSGTAGTCTRSAGSRRAWSSGGERWSWTRSTRR